MSRIANTSTFAAIAERKRAGRVAILISGGPGGGVRLRVAPLVGAVRDASMRARAYGVLSALPLPAGYPVGGMVGEQWRAALQIATDQTGMIGVAIVAWILAWSRIRRGNRDV
ncbi:hypothetical protein SR870_19395 [Rhodopseudomonas palustris]|uniref:hypothetical protein n=1 Tax=Rhodopseudomonas palustris TaxID=1076 RepID=UPI002ACEBBDA|nr:hypothetical protein [Rhodopseudomonas palustris]WQG98830.1 hypothetical protein SR870_19395 [Rhodopseudomonas palustris]